jgi:hypothetical protein
MAMTKLFATVRRVDIGRIERFHWSAWITCVLANQASRVRFVGSQELLMATLVVRDPACRGGFARCRAFR